MNMAWLEREREKQWQLTCKTVTKQRKTMDSDLCFGQWSSVSENIAEQTAFFHFNINTNEKTWKNGTKQDGRTTADHLHIKPRRSKQDFDY